MIDKLNVTNAKTTTQIEITHAFANWIDFYSQTTKTKKKNVNFVVLKLTKIASNATVKISAQNANNFTTGVNTI